MQHPARGPGRARSFAQDAHDPFRRVSDTAAPPGNPMSKPTFAPTALAVALLSTLALGGCQQNGTAAIASAEAAPGKRSLHIDESKLPPVNRFAPSDLDKSKSACSDFGGYVNGKWQAANEIPGDRASWGAFDMLDERSIAVQRQLAEQAAADPAATGVEKIVSDFWATGMDEAKVNAQGIAPMKDRLAAIDALTDKDTVANYLRTSAAKGENVLFGFGSSPDFKDSTMNMAFASQDGLGLPDRGYYFDKDKKDKLDAYQAHVAKVLELSGIPATDAATQAQAVVAFETRLARVSKSREEMQRDVSIYYNPVTLADADKLTPNFSWTEFFASQGVAAPAKFSLAMPAFHQEVSKMLADVPVGTWKSYLRFHTVDEASPYLSDAFVQENYNFYGKTMRGQKEQKARWKRVLGAMNGEVGEAFGQDYVKVAFPA